MVVVLWRKEQTSFRTIVFWVCVSLVLVCWFCVCVCVWFHSFYLLHSRVEFGCSNVFFFWLVCFFFVHRSLPVCCLAAVRPYRFWIFSSSRSIRTVRFSSVVVGVLFLSLCVLVSATHRECGIKFVCGCVRQKRDSIPQSDVEGR